jgi:predicted transcriptional regulator
MEEHMELSKKTTILFPPELHERLRSLAAARDISLGDLVRRACEHEYGLASREARLAAVDELADLELPVGTPQQMATQSVPDPAELLP